MLQRPLGHCQFWEFVFVAKQSKTAVVQPGILLSRWRFLHQAFPADCIDLTAVYCCQFPSCLLQNLQLLTPRRQDCTKAGSSDGTQHCWAQGLSQRSWVLVGRSVSDLVARCRLTATTQPSATTPHMITQFKTLVGVVVLIVVLSLFLGYVVLTCFALSGNFNWCVVPRSGEDALLFAGIGVAASCIVFGRFSTLSILLLGEQSFRPSASPWSATACCAVAAVRCS